jgi:hypothetical protein
MNKSKGSPSHLEEGQSHVEDDVQTLEEDKNKTIITGL